MTASQHAKETSLAQALTLFGSQGGRDHLIRTLKQMPGLAELELAPVLREAIELDNQGEAFLTSKRLLDAQPQWLDAPCGKDGDTPLMCAAEGGAPAIMAWLIAQGADATCVDGKGANTFHYLARSEIDHGEKRNAEIQRAASHLLIQAGCDPLLSDQDDNTPRTLAHSGDTPSLFAAEEERRRLELGTGSARGKTGGLRL